MIAFEVQNCKIMLDAFQGPTFLDSEKSNCSPEFLPLTYLTKILSDVESQGKRHFP